jgi:hypothetical protein
MDKASMTIKAAQKNFQADGVERRLIFTTVPPSQGRESGIQPAAEMAGNIMSSVYKIANFMPIGNRLNTCGEIPEKLIILPRS